jgi:hypothetical protein
VSGAIVRLSVRTSASSPRIVEAGTLLWIDGARQNSTSTSYQAAPDGGVPVRPLVPEPWTVSMLPRGVVAATSIGIGDPAGDACRDGTIAH